MGGAAGLATLDPLVRRKAEELAARGIVTIEDFDSRVITGLRELGAHTAAVAVDRLGTSHMTDIRSKAGFFMGAFSLSLSLSFTLLVSFLVESLYTYCCADLE